MTELTTVMIVGATSDIGQAIGRAFAAKGHKLVLCARRAEALKPEAANLRVRYGAAVDVVTLDALDLAAHASVLDSILVLPDVVVMVVGLLGDQLLATRDVEHAKEIMRTNYEAPALFLGEVANRMEQRGSGTIIGISSVAGERGRATNYIYGSAKAGFTAFLSGLRNRLAKKGVHVLTVKPGFVATRMTEGMELPKTLTAVPSEVAEAVLAAVERGRDVIYVRRAWGPIMMAIRLLPERLFKRMKI